MCLVQTIQELRPALGGKDRATYMARFMAVFGVSTMQVTQATQVLATYVHVASPFLPDGLNATPIS